MMSVKAHLSSSCKISKVCIWAGMENYCSCFPSNFWKLREHKSHVDTNSRSYATVQVGDCIWGCGSLVAKEGLPVPLLLGSGASNLVANRPKHLFKFRTKASIQTPPETVTQTSIHSKSM